MGGSLAGRDMVPMVSVLFIGLGFIICIYQRDPDDGVLMLYKNLMYIHT